MVVEEALKRVLAWLVREWHRTGNRWARVDSDSSLARDARLPNDRIAGPAVRLGEQNGWIERQRDDSPAFNGVSIRLSVAGQIIGEAEIRRQESQADREPSVT